MNERILAGIAIVLTFSFLVYYAVRIASVPLSIIIGAVLIMAVVEYVEMLRGKGPGGPER